LSQNNDFAIKTDSDTVVPAFHVQQPDGSGRKPDWFRLQEDLVVLMKGFHFAKELLFLSVNIY
jgi:hypothetical protein